MLTGGQYRVLRLILGGMKTGEAALKLGLTPATVANSLRRAAEAVPGLGPAVGLVRQVHKEQRRLKRSA